MSSQRETYRIVNIRPSVHTKDADEDDKLDAITLDDDDIRTVHVPSKSHDFSVNDEVYMEGKPPECTLHPVK